MLGVCAKKIKEKNEILLKYFVIKESTLEACRRIVMLPIEVKFTTKILNSIKVIVQYVLLSNNVCTRLVLAVVTEMST